MSEKYNIRTEMYEHFVMETMFITSQDMTKRTYPICKERNLLDAVIDEVTFKIYAT